MASVAGHNFRILFCWKVLTSKRYDFSFAIFQAFFCSQRYKLIVYQSKYKLYLLINEFYAKEVTLALIHASQAKRGEEAPKLLRASFSPTSVKSSGKAQETDQIGRESSPGGQASTP